MEEERRKKRDWNDPFDDFLNEIFDLFRKMDMDLSEMVASEGALVDSDEKYEEVDDWETDRWFEPGGEFEDTDIGSVDVIELDDEVVITSFLPGLSKETISVSIKDNELIIRAAGRIRRVKIGPPIDVSTAKATYRNGILEVRVKKVR